MSEDSMILSHLQSGKTISPRDAYLLYGCLALHSAAARLRKEGHNIVCTMRHSNGKRYGEYSLNSAPQDEMLHVGPSTRPESVGYGQREAMAPAVAEPA